MKHCGNSRRLSRTLYKILSAPVTLITVPPGTGAEEAVRSFLKKRREIHTEEISVTGPGAEGEAFQAMHRMEESGFSVLLLSNADRIPASFMELFLHQYFLSANPRRHLVLLADKPPRCFPEELFFSRDCLWLSRESFFFTREEAEALFMKNGKFLSKEVWEMTLGWPAMLEIFLKSQGQARSECISFIKTHIFSEMAEPLRLGIARLSFLESFMESEAVILLEDSRAGRMLDTYLSLGILFREEEGRCRFHPLVRAAGQELAGAAGLERMSIPLRKRNQAAARAGIPSRAIG